MQSHDTWGVWSSDDGVEATPKHLPKWVSYGAPHDTQKVCCSDDSVKAAWKHLYKWVSYDTREVCCSDDREEAAQKRPLNGSYMKPHVMSMDLLLCNCLSGG